MVTRAGSSSMLSRQLWGSALILAMSGLLGLPETAGKRVVMLPNPLTSHTNYHTNVARALHARGHDVWITMPDYLVRKGQLNMKNFTAINYATTVNVEDTAMFSSRDSYFNGEREDIVMMIGLIKGFCDSTLRNESLFRQIRDIKPDLVVIDNLPQVKMLAVLPYKMGVPFAFLGSIYHPLDQRIPFSPAVLPMPIFKVSDRMSFFQRVLNTLVAIIWSMVDPFMYTDAVARYAPERPYMSADMLVARAEIWLIEMDHILDYPRPTLPNIKLIGGTATGPAKALPPNLQRFMDDAKEGVVIVTFGSYVLDVPEVISKKLWAVFKQLPYKVIFRSNLTSPDPERILTSTWIPQNDLLGHPNTKVFVSHCGKNGQYEALYHAVPVVATPMFGDQPYNAERMRIKGFAEVVDLRTASVEEWVSTILMVAGNPKYKQAISAASRLFRQQYHVPMDEAAFWLEHVMQYGGAYMRSSGHDMPLYQFLLFDVIGFLVVCALTIATIFISTIYLIVNFACKKERRQRVLLLFLSERTISVCDKKSRRIFRKVIRSCKKSFLAFPRIFLFKLGTDKPQSRSYTRRLECG